MSINKVTLIGNLGKDPELRYMPNGNAVANFSLATSDKWKDKQTGEKKEKTEWHKVSVFGPLADIVGQYVRKGSKLYVEGKLQTRKWQDNDGNDRYSTEIVVQGFGGVIEILNKVDAQPQQNAQQQQAPAQMAPAYQPAPQQSAPQSWGNAPQNTPSQGAPQQAPTPKNQQNAPQQGGAMDFDDDIPFS